MTRIDFHLHVEDALLYTCRLVRKAYGSGLKPVVFCKDDTVLAQLDQLLWSFSEDDFLPHAKTGTAAVQQSPIVLTHQAEDIVHYDLLINLDSECAPFFARFDRLIEIVGTTEPAKQQARERYKFYKDRGYPLQTFERG
ncbi:MAG: DNA polymerase III subunit chi [Limnobacter sp.]|nr:DNA polymerase III subunit chi [Limnobacter sp.]